MTGTASKAVSNREMARRLDVDEKAVRKGIASGRLRECLGADDRGRVIIIDADLAEQEWKRNAGKVGKGADDGARTPQSAPSAETGGTVVEAGSLVEAQRHATNERARKLKMENDVREGRLADVNVVAREAFNAQRAIREAVLNIPARLSGELAAERDATKVHLKLEAALREALEAAATGILQAAVNG